MKNKTNFILSGLLIIAILLAIKSKYNEQKLTKKLETLTDSLARSSQELSPKKELLDIDSLLIEGKYETALNAYKEEFKNIETNNNNKEKVQFRIKIANQFLDLNKKQKTESATKSIIKTDANIKSENYSTTNKNTNKILEKEVPQPITKTEKPKTEYLLFKSSRKHELHYIGEINNGKANGYGIAIFDTGSRYEGEWVNNSRQGKGTFYWNDGHYYKGEYKNDLRHGTGTYYWKKGDKYIGQWEKDKRHGKGVFYYKNGKTVKGTWKKDKLIEEDR